MGPARHVSIANRLRRAEGHIRSLVSMIDSGRDCVELAQQLHAIEAAIANAKRELVHAHLSHCLDGALNNGTMSSEQAITEMRALTKYL
ncbi:MAG: metal-sensing transcriptional repressor [Hyphomicrobium sp.]|nr:metal-sensing transcriptional repressor [Hyphomicrobium sp.]